MLSRLKEFLGRVTEGGLEERSGPHAERLLELATAALLIEVSRSDARVDAAEESAILGAVERRFGLDRSDTHALVDAAESAADRAVSLSEFTQLLNERLPPEERVHIVELLWQVALADGRIDKYEDYYVRKIAELLYVSHGDFIRMKLKVSAAAGVG